MTKAPTVAAAIESSDDQRVGCRVCCPRYSSILIIAARLVFRRLSGRADRENRPYFDLSWPRCGVTLMAKAEQNWQESMPGADVTRRLLLAGLAAAPFAPNAEAQAIWPNRPVRVMVPYPPAGGADTTARIVFAKLGELLGQQFVIENRGGAGGTIGEAVVAKADPDGYTVLHDATAFSVNSSLYSNLPFDYTKDFDPVAL